MGLLDRLFGGDAGSPPVPSAVPSAVPVAAERLGCCGYGRRPSWMSDGMTVTCYDGHETLEVVGESYRQDELWDVVGRAPTSASIRHPVMVLLVPEDGNPYDDHAVGVWVGGHLVGYLSRDDASAYRPGIMRLIETGGPVALRGVVVGGGRESIAMLGVFLDHDPTDFGIAATAYVSLGGEMRTGFSEALRADAADDSYDLSWYFTLSQDTRTAVGQLQQLLASDPDPIDRHFMFCELEARFYRLRDVEPSALIEYDRTCLHHDSEMERIRPALVERLGAMPLLETYRQQCIRQTKAKELGRALWWAERGLALYGDDAYSRDWVDDLTKRVGACKAKLDAPARSPHRAAPSRDVVAVVATVEVLICERCGSQWERTVTRGRKPKLCPTCAPG